MRSDWLKFVTWLITSNQSNLYEGKVKTLLRNWLLQGTRQTIARQEEQF